MRPHGPGLRGARGERRPCPYGATGAHDPQWRPTAAAGIRLRRAPGGSLAPPPAPYLFKNLIDAGLGLEKVAALAGHERLETTRRYCTPSLKDLEHAVELIGEEA
jgi:hypothetical protein